jgi:nitrogen regulatory protein P-II 1
MKKIEAIIQPHKLDEVKEAMKTVGVEGITVSEVRGHGRQKGHTETYRGAEYTIDLLPKLKLEMIIADARLEEILMALSTSAKSGKIGDGKIFVSHIEDVLRIRNGDRGEAAL